jgi:hypothetical protein
MLIIDSINIQHLYPYVSIYLYVHVCVYMYNRRSIDGSIPIISIDMGCHLACLISTVPEVYGLAASFARCETSAYTCDIWVRLRSSHRLGIGTVTCSTGKAAKQSMSEFSFKTAKNILLNESRS